MGVWAFLINILVMFLILQSYGHFFKKSTGRRMTDISIWNELFSIVAFLGIIYNGCILCKTRKDIFETKPQIIVDMDDTQFTVLLVVLEHLVFTMVYIWTKTIPEMPLWVKMKLRHEKLQTITHEECREKKLSKLFKRLDIDEVRDDEEKELEHVYDKGCSLVNMHLPLGYNQFPLINVE